MAEIEGEHTLVHSTSERVIPLEVESGDVLGSEVTSQEFFVNIDGKDVKIDEENAAKLGIELPASDDKPASAELINFKTTKIEVVTIAEGSFLVSTVEGYYDMVAKQINYERINTDDGQPIDIDEYLKKQGVESLDDLEDEERDKFLAKTKLVKVETPHVYRLRKKSVKWRPIAVGPNGLPMTVQPVEKAKIYSARTKPTSREHKIIHVSSDAQIGYRRLADGEYLPLHDERAMEADYQLIKYLNPDSVVDTGDTTDWPELSHFPADSDHFTNGTFQLGLQRTHDHFAQQTANSPNAEKRTAVDSNHVERMTKFILGRSPQLYNIRAVGDKYPSYSYPGLVKLDEAGWDWVDGYGAAVYEYKDDLAFIHGTTAVAKGSTSYRLGSEIHNIDRNIVQGHAHRIETQYHTDRRGRSFGSFVVGALCHIDGRVPSYHSAIDINNRPVDYKENWQQGVMVIHDYGDGKYVFDQVPIHDGVLYYNGKVFDGTEGRTIIA
jgi:hypothetical protein